MEPHLIIKGVPLNRGVALKINISSHIPDTCQWVLPEPRCSNSQSVGRDGLGGGPLHLRHTHHLHRHVWRRTAPDGRLHSSADVFSDHLVPEGTSSAAYDQSHPAHEACHLGCGARMEATLAWSSDTLVLHIHVCQSWSTGRQGVQAINYILYH